MMAVPADQAAAVAHLPPARAVARWPRYALRLGTALAAVSLTSAQPAPELDPMVVTVTRSARAATQLPMTVDVLGPEAFVTTPVLMVDDMLKTSAAFSLFRRTGSLMANPTAQGVSLRNLGPSGAGRTLVLLDGVPLNDPFGGWVAWTKVSRLSLAGAEIVRGGGSSAWGSAALGGTIQFLTTAAPSLATPARESRDRSSTADPASPAFAGQFLAEVGDFSTRSAEILARGSTGAGHLQVTAKTFDTDGFWRVGARDRGPIDRRTDQDHQVAQISWRHITAGGTTTGLSARYYREERGNGTPLQRNDTREGFFSGNASGRLAGIDGDWTASAYVQTQEFRSRFTAVSEDRASETPALDQFAVPADAAGAAAVLTWRGEGSATTTMGADARWVRGETQEAYLLQNGAFTRHRFAGGEQRFVGVFAQHDRALAPDWRMTLGARGDFWENRDGRRREVELSTGAAVRDETFATRDGVEFSPSAGLVWQVREAIRLRAAAYQAFRVPTLNELYRPFRVGNVITEANAALAVENLTGAEIGTDFTGARGSLALTGFINELHDAVSNVTIGPGPGNVPGVGFVPAGGVGRQRRNLERVRVRGFEVTGRWQASPALRLRADYLFSDATVRRAASPAEDLAGRRLAQVPRHTLTAGVDWRSDGWNANAQVRHVSTAFEDDANRLELAPATTLDLRLGRSIGRDDAGEVFVAVENLFNEIVEAGRDADGRIDLGQPRFAHGGIRWRW